MIVGAQEANAASTVTTIPFAGANLKARHPDEPSATAQGRRIGRFVFLIPVHVATASNERVASEKQPVSRARKAKAKAATPNTVPVRSFPIPPACVANT